MIDGAVRLAGSAARLSVRLLQGLLRGIVPSEGVVLVGEDISPDDLPEIRRRLAHFAPALIGRLRVDRRLTVTTAASTVPVLLFGRSPRFAEMVASLRPGTFDVDQRRNPVDGWAWNHLANYCASPATSHRSAARDLHDRIAQLRAEHPFDRTYVFGTGPSLAAASDREWRDGYRIVCNTIVRDPVLWRHLDPHFFVAADAIYHFGHTAFARAFRHDLAERLRETRTTFLCPSTFEAVARREFDWLGERLITVPVGRHQRMHVDLLRRFKLPRLGNVLPGVLLPLACTLSRRIFLWGFDGRAPNDALFWSNSARHSYPELLASLPEAHPAFFEFFVPGDRPSSYVERYHGDLLERRLAAAESAGWSFVMMHRSWTATLQKRYVPG